MADWEMKDYNPEWISIDVWGYNFIIPEMTGMVFHDCIGSLDLSLVVTGDIDTTCCNDDGIRGDADGSGGGPNIADVIYLVQFIFFGGPAPPCFEEGDVDGSGSINVADAVYLVQFIFFGGPPPAPCP